MIYEEDHLDIREKLQKLPKIKAGDNFINLLQQKLNLTDAEFNNLSADEIKKESFLKKFLVNKRYPWLIPASGFAVILLLVFSVYYINNEKKNNISPIIQNQDKQQSPSGEIKQTDEFKKKENLPGKEIASDLETETRKNDVRTKSETTKGLLEQPVQPAPKVSTTVTPAEKEKTVYEQEIKPQIKAEEKIIEYKKNEDALRKEETGKIKTESPVNSKKDEMKKSKDKGESNDAKSVETTLGRSMKGSKDTSAVNQKTLEKLREEIMKSEKK